MSEQPTDDSLHGEEIDDGTGVEDEMPSVSERLRDVILAPRRAFRHENVATDHVNQIVAGLGLYVGLGLAMIGLMIAVVASRADIAGEWREAFGDIGVAGVTAMVVVSVASMIVSSVIAAAIGGGVIFLLARLLEKRDQSQVRFTGAFAVSALSFVIIALIPLFQWIVVAVAGVDNFLPQINPFHRASIWPFFHLLTTLLYLWPIVVVGYGVMHLSGASAAQSIGAVFLVAVILVVVFLLLVWLYISSLPNWSIPTAVPV